MRRTTAQERLRRTPPRPRRPAVIGLEEQSPLVKQSSVVLLFGIAVALSVLVPTIRITDAHAMIAAGLVMTAATVLAAALSRKRANQQLALVVPAIDFVVVGILRFATGESASIFASLVILPTVWIAASPGRRKVLYAFLGICLALLVPFLLGSSLEENPNELARGLFSAAVFTVAAAVVNDLARAARAHIAGIRARERLTQLELDEASQVQQALLPKVGSGSVGYDVDGVCIPSKAVGGDFFDWYPVDGGTAFTLGDVMGKGVGAGIIAATVRAVIRSARSHDDLAIPLERASVALASDLVDTASFATLFHARLDDSTGAVRYVDAGHGLTLHVRADGSWTRLASFNLPVGIPGDEDWTVSRVQLDPGDAIVCCSDGILDLYDGTVESLQHVAEMVSSTPDAAEFVARIRALADEATAREDDVTAIILRRAAA